MSIGERVLPRAARERWLKPLPEPEPVELEENEDLLTVLVEPISRRHPDVTYTAKPAVMRKDVKAGLEQEWVMTTPVEWGPSQINDVVTRARIYQADTNELLVDVELMTHTEVSIGDTMAWEVNDLKIVMSP